MFYLTRTILIAVCLAVLTVSFVVAQERQSDLFEIKVNGKSGFIDRNGKVVIEPSLNGVYDFSEGLAVAYIGKGQFDTGYIDQTGAIAINPQFNIASKFIDGLAWAGIDPNRKPYKLGPLTLYSSQSSHSFDYNIGFIDKSGKWVVEPIYKFAGDFSEGLALVRTSENKYGFIDETGKVVIPMKYEWVSSFSEGLAAVFEKGKYGFIDKTGKTIIKPKYSRAFDFSEGLACVKIGGRIRNPSFGGEQVITTSNVDLDYGYIDKNGKLVFALKAYDCRSFSEGLARFEIGGNWGFVDKHGKIIIESKIDAISDFSEGLARVLLSDEKGGYGFIDQSGKIVIRSKFPYVDDFKNGLAQIADNIRLYDASFGYIDKTGKVIWQPTK